MLRSNARKRAGPGVSLHTGRSVVGSTSPTYLAARPPTRVLGSTVRTDTTRVPRRRSDRVFLSILLVSVSSIYSYLRPMRNGNALTYSGVYRSRTESMRCAPAHMRMREGGGRHRRRSAVFALSFAPAFSTAKQKLQKLTIAIGPRGRLSAHRVGADPARGPMTQTPVPFPSPSIDTSSQRNPPFPRRGGRSRKTACYDV